MSCKDGRVMITIDCTECKKKVTGKVAVGAVDRVMEKSKCKSCGGTGWAKEKKPGKQKRKQAK